MEMIQEKAEGKGVTLEEMLELDAKWLIENEGNQTNMGENE